MQKIGIVGFGGAGMAQADHFRALGCQVTTIYDPKPEAHARARNFSADVKVTADYDAFLREDIDAVSICSPDRTHASYYARSLRAGINVDATNPPICPWAFGFAFS